jgi:tryptophan synthase alpha chain
MNRIDELFRQLRESGRKGFIPFITAGDPDLDMSLQIAVKLADLGASIIELGVPFSDPMADGPTIQLSSQRALKKGVDLASVLRLVREFRKTSDVSIVLFSYLNPLLTYGLDELARDASDAGIDGVLVTDAVDNEAQAIRGILNDRDLKLISLIAPTTTDERLRTIGRSADGFLYAVSRAGVTGAKSEMSLEAEQLVGRARNFSELPIVVGFGISTAEQIADVWRYSDAAVVGSAIVNQIAGAQMGEEVLAVERFVCSLLPRFAKSGAEI